MCDDLKFRHPFSCIMSGPSGPGMSSFFILFLQKFDVLSTEQKFGDSVVWCYCEMSAIHPRQQLPANINFNAGKPDASGDARGEHWPLILDDLLNDVYSKQACDLFTRGSHHLNISVILITQILLFEGRSCMDISLNDHHIVSLKNVRDMKQFRYLSNQGIPKIISVCRTLS